VDGTAAAEETVKKSRFVARACGSCLQFSDAKAFMQRVSDPKARHNCWAWVGQRSQRSSDDGEPSGTAGRPILNAIEGQGLSDVVVVVTRYKSKDAPMLGAGGLLRAYGSAASLVLRSAPLVTVVPSSELRCTFPMAELGSVQSLVARFESRKPGSGALIRGDEDYGDDGSVTLGVVVETAFVEAFSSELREATNGAATVEEEQEDEEGEDAGAAIPAAGEEGEEAEEEEGRGEAGAEAEEEAGDDTSAGQQRREKRGKKGKRKS